MVTSAAANWFAPVSILAWFLVSMILYAAKPFREATLWTVLGALLLLPSNFSIKFETIPALDKNSVPSLAIAVAYLFWPRRVQTTKLRISLVELLIGLHIVSPLLTSANNGDAIIYGDLLLPGVGYYDGISACIGEFLLFLPFIIGRRLFQSTRDIELALRTLAKAGLFYSLPMLFEIKMSPQLSIWLYGYFPSGLNTEVRYGGFRPVVFMKNGLAASFFLMTVFLASLCLRMVPTRVNTYASTLVPPYLAVVLLLCKSAGALIYAATTAFATLFFSPRLQTRIAVLIVAIGLLYPFLRAANLFPTQDLVSAAALFSQERADSLETRFTQENQLLARASERLLLGWGRYGRNRVYDETGKDLSLTDGAWLQTLGQFGLLGFGSLFGLLAIPVFRAFAAASRPVGSASDQRLLACLSMIVSITLFEQIPNSSMSPWSWLLAGALLGHTEAIQFLAKKKRQRSGSKILLETASTQVGTQDSN